jgi:prepilin-type N-terminal cleavage/methylation domain-containing protein
MKKARGFTLIELMVVIVIVAIVGSVVFGIVRNHSFNPTKEYHINK